MLKHPHYAQMYGPPPDCKRFEDGRRDSLRKCIRPLSGESLSSREAGALITRRLQELLGVPAPTLESETHSAKPHSENEYRHYPNERFNLGHRVRLH